MRTERPSGDEDVGGGHLWGGVEEVQLLEEGERPDVGIILDVVGPEEGQDSLLQILG